MDMHNGKSAAEWYSLYSQAVLSRHKKTLIVSFGNAIELMPCPFCGRSDLLSFEPYPEDGFIGVRCRACGCIGPAKASETEAEAAAHWNARQDGQPLADVTKSRYRLFAGDCYYASGGMHDFKGGFASIDLAKQQAFFEWWHIWDTVESKCVASSGRQPFNAPARPPE